MKPKMQRVKDFAFAVLGPFFGQNMPIFAGCATLFLLTASFPLLIWVLVVVNHLPAYSIADVADLLCQFLPQVPEIQDTVVEVLYGLNAQSTTFVASFAAVTTLFSASGGMTAIQKGLQRLTPGARFKLYDRLLAILYTVVFEGLLLVAHLAVGQAHGHTGSIDGGHGVGGKDLVQVGGVGGGDGVAEGMVGRPAETVHDAE